MRYGALSRKTHMKYLTLILFLFSMSGVSKSEVFEGELLEREGLFYKPWSIAPYTGTNISWHGNGQLKQRGAYKDGEKHGLFEIYYDNGQLKRKGVYTRGKPNGFPEWFHKNGQLEQKGKYIEGKKDGLFEVLNLYFKKV